MTKITESAIEKFPIELLEKQGHQYIYAFACNLQKVNDYLVIRQKFIIKGFVFSNLAR